MELNGELQTHMQLIQVLYRNGRGGPVDEITLDELIRSRKITHFYRPSEERWIDIFVDSVRQGYHSADRAHLKRRYADQENGSGDGARSGKLFSRLFTRFTKHPPQLSATSWLQRGLSAVDDLTAARAFASCIRLNPHHQEAYLRRGLTYEAVGNFQQALEDYNAAIALDPSGDGYGLILGRPGVTAEARAGLRRAADLQRASTCRLLASPKELRLALKAFTEPHCKERKAGDSETEGSLKVGAKIQRLIEKYAKRISQVETYLQEVQQKRDVLVEAARLVEEELQTRRRTLYGTLSDANVEKDQH